MRFLFASVHSPSSLFSLAAMDDDAITTALGAQLLLERTAAFGSLLATLWPELLQLSVPAKVVLATIGEKRNGRIFDFLMGRHRFSPSTSFLLLNSFSFPLLLNKKTKQKQPCSPSSWSSACSG